MKVRKYFTYDEADECFLVMQQIGPDYLLRVMLRECDEIYALHNNSPRYEVKAIFNWCLELGLLETMEILVGEDLQIRVED